MEYRKIGKTGPEVSVLSLGSWNTYNRMLFEDAVELVRGAHKLGINFFDTSFYPIGPHETRAGPHTEVIFGRILEASGIRRQDYVLTEKLWFYSYPEQSLDDQLRRSLFRLNLPQVDLVSVAMPRPELDLEAVLREIAAIIASGKAIAWGTMNWTAEGLRRAWDICAAQGLPKPTIVQIKYSVLRRNVIESEAWQRLFSETDIALHPSDSLEGGLLAGKLAPERETGSDNGRLRPDLIARFPDYEALARQYDATPAQLSLAFCLAHPATASILIGASSLDQLQENIGAIGLSKRYRDQLGTIVAPFAAAAHHTDKAYGGRLPPLDLGGFKGSYVRPS
jgi:aryl-alcohol dehydrogenase-like predicted oxidoreductase